MVSALRRQPEASLKARAVERARQAITFGLMMAVWLPDAGGDQKTRLVGWPTRVSHCVAIGDVVRVRPAESVFFCRSIGTRCFAGESAVNQAPITGERPCRF